nr:hypothetical protein TgIb.1640 [Toxoplasma gondii RH]
MARKANSYVLFFFLLRPFGNCFLRQQLHPCGAWSLVVIIQWDIPSLEGSVEAAIIRTERPVLMSSEEDVAAQPHTSFANGSSLDPFRAQALDNAPEASPQKGQTQGHLLFSDTMIAITWDGSHQQPTPVAGETTKTTRDLWYTAGNSPRGEEDEDARRIDQEGAFIDTSSADDKGYMTGDTNVDASSTNDKMRTKTKARMETKTGSTGRQSNPVSFENQRTAVSENADKEKDRIQVCANDRKRYRRLAINEITVSSLKHLFLPGIYFGSQKMRNPISGDGTDIATPDGKDAREETIMLSAVEEAEGIVQGQALWDETFITLKRKNIPNITYTVDQVNEDVGIFLESVQVCQNLGNFLRDIGTNMRRVFQDSYAFGIHKRAEELAGFLHYTIVSQTVTEALFEFVEQHVTVAALEAVLNATSSVIEIPSDSQVFKLINALLSLGGDFYSLADMTAVDFENKNIVRSKVRNAFYCRLFNGRLRFCMPSVIPPTSVATIPRETVFDPATGFIKFIYLIGFQFSCEQQGLRPSVVDASQASWAAITPFFPESYYAATRVNRGPVPLAVASLPAVPPLDYSRDMVRLQRRLLLGGL